MSMDIVAEVPPLTSEQLLEPGKSPKRAGLYFLPEVFQTRYMLNGMAAALAASRLTNAEVERFRQVTNAMREAAKQQDLAAVGEQDFAFHSMIFGCCGNRMLQSMAESVHLERHESMTLATANHYGIARAVEEHQAVVDAFALRDSAKAQAAIQIHIRHAAHRAGVDLAALHPLFGVGQRR